MKYWSVFIVFLIFLILTICFVIYRIFLQSLPSINTNLPKIESELKTGDILVVAYNSVYSGLIKIFNGSHWSHGSFVLKEKEQIYILEVACYRSGDKITYKGLIKIPWKEWIYYNSGRYIGYCKYKDDTKRPNFRRVIKLFKKYKDIKVNLDTLYWLNTLSVSYYDQEKYKYYYRKKRKYFCTEFLADFLQQLGMIKKKYLPCNYSPSYLSKLREYHSAKIFKI